MSAADHAKRVIEVAGADLVQDVSGYVVFWPRGNRGFYNAPDLRAIADELDRRNAAWDAYVSAVLERAGNDQLSTPVNLDQKTE